MRTGPAVGKLVGWSLVLGVSGIVGVASTGGAQSPEKKDTMAATAAIGIAVGEKAPAFALKDQHGHLQTNETLKGSKGTVLVFVRSADW